MSSANPPLLGRLVDGRYRVDDVIAEGGMATVYRGRDLRLDRPVAVKVMREDLARDDSFVRRFVQEARSAARLSHPHIVSVWDQGDDGDLVYLVMELVDGPTLRDVIAHRTPATPRQALTLLIPVAEALEAAHQRGLVHRDIKPENVLLAEGRGTGVKVADFGLARAVSAAAGEHTSEMVWGTAAYLAPEQVEKRAPDARTDVYAVGLLLFELLTGRKAFPGGDPVQVAYDHLHSGTPDVRDLAPTVPDRLADLIARSTATDPDERPHDAGRLLREMRALLEELPADELDALPDAAEATAATDVTDPDATAAVPVAGDPTQLVQARGEGADSTRRIPVPAGEGHYARTTGNVSAARAQRARRAQPSRAPEPAPRRRGAGGLLLTILLLLVLAGGGYAVWYLTAGPAVHSTVPDVVGASEEDATRQLRGLQLDPSVTYAYSEDVEAGIVMATDRDPGTELRHGSDVELTVSQGPERYAVPQVVGLTQDAATTAVESANLTVGEITREHDEDEPEGRVLRADPEPGEPLPPDGAVDLVVSDGPAPVDVPDVTGRTQDEASRTLVEAGLTVSIDPQRVHDDEVPEGSVVSQDPASGSVERGTGVTLRISDGPELVEMPDVVGRQFGEAAEELESLGLEVAREDVRGGFFGTVRDQSVEPGQEVRVGTEVVLSVV